ncbi:MAG TPA: hypothetical protein VM901_13430 [Bdellovibrionota bacterium]|jgi:hypothetical protein|nr:hypothetical protein [Bdellovibrionota bacterium]
MRNLILSALFLSLAPAHAEETLCDFTIDTFGIPLGSPWNDPNDSHNVPKVDLDNLDSEYRRLGKIVYKADSSEPVYGKISEAREREQELLFLSGEAKTKDAAFRQVDCVNKNLSELLKRDEAKFRGATLEISGGWGGIAKYSVNFLTELDPKSVKVDYATATVNESYNAATGRIEESSYTWSIGFKVDLNSQNFSYYDRPEEGYEKLYEAELIVEDKE